jgi:hypothetical protein
MRITFGTVAGDAGVPTHVLRDVLGHAAPRTSPIHTRRRRPTAKRASEAVGRAFSEGRGKGRGRRRDRLAGYV